MNLVAWRGRNSVNVMATKADVAALLGTMKEMKLYSSAVLEAVLEAKKVRDAERAVRNGEKQEANEAVATTDETNVVPVVQDKDDQEPPMSA